MPGTPAPQTIRVRPVRGRIIDPYRGTPDADQDAGRFEPRAADAQPIDDIVARLEAVSGAKLARRGRRFTLTRGDESLLIAFASAARYVSLDDATFEGDPVLAIDAARSLLTLFGPVELRTGKFRDLIDSHEPAEAVAARYRAYWIEQALSTAQQMFDKAPPRQAARPAAAPVAARRMSRANPKVFAAVLVGILFALLAGGLLFGSRGCGRSAGEPCTQNDDCSSDECLPREPVRSTNLGGFDSAIFQPQSSKGPIAGGVCTRECGGGCPAGMSCGTVMQYQLGLGHRTTRCVPVAWTDDATP